MKESKVILITGSSSGFGLMAARQYADRGDIVYATMRNVDGKNAEVATELSRHRDRIKVLDLDVTDEASVQSAVKAIIEERGRIDVLINNAGVMNVGLTEGFTIDQLKSQMDVNYFGVARMFKAVVPHMRKAQNGLVITVTSIAGRLGFPALYSYCASKYAAEALAEGYRYELSQYGVDSVIIEPGPFGTDLINNSPRPKDTDVLDSYGEFAEMPEAVIANFEAFIAENIDGGDCNPQIVVNDMLTLTDTPFGQRPLRTVSGLDYGTRALNEVYSQYELGILDAMGMSSLNPNKGDTQDAA